MVNLELRISRYSGNLTQHLPGSHDLCSGNRKSDGKREERVC